MWFKKLKKKKIQCFLIMILLFLSSLIFASSLSMVTSINSYVSKYYSNNKFYNLVFINSNGNATRDIVKWCSNNSGVKDVKVMDAYTSGNDIYNKNKKLKIALYSVASLQDYKNIPFGISRIKYLNDSLSVEERSRSNYNSAEVKCPMQGEIWITQLSAESYNIHLGDKLTFKTKDKNISLKVSSIINDSIQPSSSSTQIIFYVNKDNIKDFNSLTKAPLMFMNIKKDVNIVKLQKDLNSAVNVGGYAFDKDMLVELATITTSMGGGACTLASLLVFIVSILIIRFIIWNNILKEYKSIGIYKALGFSKKEILKFYITGYSLIGFIGSALGAICSIPILNYTAAKVLKYIGNFKGIDISFDVIITTIIIFSLILLINLYFVIRRTNKISPVEALRVGVSSSKKKLKKSLIKNTTASLALAINDIFKYKKISAFITLTLTLSLTFVLLFGNFNYSITRMKKNMNVWFGIPKGDLTISAPMVITTDALKDALEEVKKDSRVKSYVYGSISFNNVNMDTKKYPIKSTIYNVTIMNSYNDALGFSKVDGENPKNSNEVSVSMKILKQTGLSIGDYIELSMNNIKRTYLITGSYNAMMSEGYGIRMLSSAVKKEYPKYIGNEIFVNLKNPASMDEFKKDYTKKFEKLDTGEIEPTLEYVINSIPGILLPMTYLLMAVFIAFGVITILNIIVMNIRDNRRSFGIMKALGFTSKEIQNRYLYRILILTALSIIIAVILNLTLAGIVIALVINNLKVLIISKATMITLLFIMLTLIIAITKVSCIAIKNTKPTELIEE